MSVNNFWKNIVAAKDVIETLKATTVAANFKHFQMSISHIVK